MAALDDALRENLEHGLVGFLHATNITSTPASAPGTTYDEYHLGQFEGQKNEEEGKGDTERVEEEEDASRAEGAADTDHDEEDAGIQRVEEDASRAGEKANEKGVEDAAYDDRTRQDARSEYKDRQIPRPIPKTKASIMAALRMDDARRRRLG